MACDIRYAAESARLAETYVPMGLLPSVGVGKARELLWTGEFIDGREAERIGMVNRAIPDEG